MTREGVSYLGGSEVVLVGTRGVGGQAQADFEISRHYACMTGYTV